MQISHRYLHADRLAALAIIGDRCARALADAGRAALSLQIVSCGGRKGDQFHSISALQSLAVRCGIGVECIRS